MNTAVLVLFCKRPLINYGKQRLAAVIGPEEAHVYAEHLLECVLEDIEKWKGELVISPSRTEDMLWAEKLVGRKKSVINQGEGNLGERINRVDKQLRSLGHQNILYIGSDAPVLSINDYEDAALILEKNDVVISGALDGGVVLMGNRVMWPDLSDLPWSTDMLGKELHSLCIKNNMNTAFMTEYYDVDVPEDLVRLSEDLKHDNRISRKKLLRLLNTLEINQ